MSIIEIIFELGGGLALFLYGMILMSEGFQKMAGDKLQKILEKFTNTPIKGIVSGTVVTGIIQSSSITTVILLGFVNAGLINLKSAVGVIMGANIGTTVTAQIVALKFESLSLPIIAAGFLLWFVNKNLKFKYLGQALLGLGLLFLGMSLMSNGVAPLKDNPAIFTWFMNLGKNPFLGILVGMIFTGIIQSSSATTGLVIALAKQGLIDLPGAIPLILGANIGTCVTVLLASIGSAKEAKRMALIHLFFNVIGVILFSLVINKFIHLASLTGESVPRQIANAHTIFNIVTTLVLVWFIPQLIKLVRKIIPGEEVKLETKMIYLSKYLLGTPGIALGETFKETMRMADLTLEMMKNSFKALFNHDANLLELIRKQESSVDIFYHAIDDFGREISERSISHEESEKLSMIIHNVTDIERVGDHVNNIAHITRHKYKGDAKFSEQSLSELKEMHQKAIKIYTDAIDSWKKQDKGLARKVIEEEAEIDALEKKFRLSHIKRLEKGASDPASGVSFESLLENLERIGDHADNIAYSVIHGF